MARVLRSLCTSERDFRRGAREREWYDHTIPRDKMVADLCTLHRQKNQWEGRAVSRIEGERLPHPPDPFGTADRNNLNGKYFLSFMVNVLFLTCTIKLELVAHFKGVTGLGGECITGTGGEPDAFGTLLCLNLGGSRGSAGISTILIILSFAPELNAADCCEGFTKSLGSADLWDLAEEAHERDKFTFTASELLLLLPIKKSSKERSRTATKEPKKRRQQSLHLLQATKPNSNERKEKMKGKP
ncbi:hypothetical protein M5K25_025516 [Dendrobium thyrsiflorum]|uniref:Uncharacterized protein n=1 Tax=Dendrobium thyrsiflorum TaxID=117978 RepID=A0ABD0U9G4_DENTH